MCDPPPVAQFGVVAALVELSLGLTTVMRATRHVAALAAFALNVGFVAFAFVADSRRLPWRGCGCFGGIDLPWLPWHAVIAAALALPSLAIFLDAERRANAPPPAQPS